MTQVGQARVRRACARASSWSSSQQRRGRGTAGGVLRTLMNAHGRQAARHHAMTRHGTRLHFHGPMAGCWAAGVLGSCLWSPWHSMLCPGGCVGMLFELRPPPPPSHGPLRPVGRRAGLGWAGHSFHLLQLQLQLQLQAPANAVDSDTWLSPLTGINSCLTAARRAGRSVPVCII